MDKRKKIIIGIVIVLLTVILWFIFYNNNNNKDTLTAEQKNSFYRDLCEKYGYYFGPLAGGYKRKEEIDGQTAYLTLCYKSREDVRNNTPVSVSIQTSGVQKNSKIIKPGLVYGSLDLILNNNVVIFEESYVSVSDLRKDCISDSKNLITIKIIFYEDKAIVEEVPKCKNGYTFEGVYYKE